MNYADLIILGEPDDLHVKALVAKFLNENSSLIVCYVPPVGSGRSFQVSWAYPEETLVFILPEGVYGCRSETVIWVRTLGDAFHTVWLADAVTYYCQRETIACLEALWEAYPCVWVNPLSAVRMANNKMHQLKIAHNLGFKVPTTLVTNAKQGVLERFSAGNSCLAIKPFNRKTMMEPLLKRDLGRWLLHRLLKDTFGVSCFKQEAMNGLTEGAYTRQLSLEELTAFEVSLSLCPVSVQQYVEKSLELRINVIGDEVFAAAIQSQVPGTYQADCRKDVSQYTIDAYNLDDQTRQKCLALLKELGLKYGAIDMIITPEGEEVFLEINASPQWLWIEHKTKQPITEALAKWMINERFSCLT
jgi:hypothetical protein